MLYRVVVHRNVTKNIKQMPEPDKSRLKAAIDSLAKNPHPSTSRKLQGKSNAFRLRAGDYRILYEVHAKEIAVYVFEAGHRREIYR